MQSSLLASMLSKYNAAWLIGIINAYPTAIGKSETVLTVVGDAKVWDRSEAVIKILGGSSTLVGTDAGMLAALFAALFTTRQGFMFGMIYGALVCKKAGIPLDIFANKCRYHSESYRAIISTLPILSPKGSSITRLLR